MAASASQGRLLLGNARAWASEVNLPGSAGPHSIPGQCPGPFLSTVRVEVAEGHWVLASVCPVWEDSTGRGSRRVLRELRGKEGSR